MSEGPADTTMAIQQTSEPHTYTELMQAPNISQWSLHNPMLMPDPLILIHQIPSQMVERVDFQTQTLPPRPKFPLQHCQVTNLSNK